MRGIGARPDGAESSGSVRFSALTIVGLLVLVVGAPAGTPSSGSGPLSASSAASFVRTAIDSNATFPDIVGTARGNRFVILQSWKKDLARQLKAADPNVKVLAYKNFSFVACDEYSDGQYVPQGVRCPDVNANHPDWFLTDALGTRINSSGYPWLWLLDVGNRAYQDAWADAVVAEARADGWDGIFLDDVDPTVRYHVEPTRVARYPTDAEWRAATSSMVANVGPRIQAAGLLAIANVCCVRDHGSVWRDWLPSLSGAMDEMFTKWGNDPASGFVWDWGANGWSAQLEEVREAEAQGKYFLGIAHSRSTDARAAAYGLGTMLLAAQSRSSFALAEDYTNETRFPVYQRALQLGAPSGAHFRVGTAYRRNFSSGTVVVNASLATVQVPLGGEYVALDGTHITSVTLGATSAAILLTAPDPGGDDDPPPGDTTPPETTITAAPPRNSRSSSAMFSFAANEPGARFQCRLDGAPFADCASPTTYSGLPGGGHTFAARAIDAAGNVDATPATHSWRVKAANEGGGVLFTTSAAHASTAARPGLARRIRLRLSGRVFAGVGGRPASQVTLYRRSTRGWRAFVRLRTGATGRFRVERRIRIASRSLRVRAVAASSGLTVRSRVLVVRVRVG